MLVWCEGGWVAYSLPRDLHLASDLRYRLLGRRYSGAL
jgi:hypothetical protein